jgi:hypothetical protein
MKSSDNAQPRDKTLLFMEAFLVSPFLLGETLI